MEWSDVLAQAASGILALLLLTSFFFLSRLLKDSAVSRGLNLFLLGSVLLLIRPSILIILYQFNLRWLFGWLDVATIAVFAAGFLVIKGMLEHLVRTAVGQSLIRQLNLEEDQSRG